MKKKKLLKDSILVGFPCSPSSFFSIFQAAPKHIKILLKGITTSNSSFMAKPNKIFVSFLKCLHFLAALTLQLNSLFTVELS